MKRWQYPLTAALLALAVLVGVGLPALVVQAQQSAAEDAQEQHLPASMVSLDVTSDFSFAQKANLVSAPYSWIRLDSGRYLTAQQAKAACEEFSDALFSAEKGIAASEDTADTPSQQPTACLATSADGSGLIYWGYEMTAEDAIFGTLLLNFAVDDMSGQILSFNAQCLDGTIFEHAADYANEQYADEGGFTDEQFNAIIDDFAQRLIEVMRRNLGGTASIRASDGDYYNMDYVLYLIDYTTADAEALQAELGISWNYVEFSFFTAEYSGGAYDEQG